jgi:hypothetical protein
MVHAALVRATKFFPQSLMKRFVPRTIGTHEAETPGRSLPFDQVDAGDLA